MFSFMINDNFYTIPSHTQPSCGHDFVEAVKRLHYEHILSDIIYGIKVLGVFETVQLSIPKNNFA